MSVRRATVRTAAAHGAVALVLGACAVRPYQPAELDLATPLGDAEFRQVVDVVRTIYPQLHVDAAQHRLQSSWIRHAERGTPARRRATVYEDPPGVLSVLVEVQYLRVGAFREPSWTATRGHARWERELLDAIEQGLADV